jgi:uncharacterized membrane protein (GlpM family)
MSTFLLKLILTFTVGGAWISLVTVLAEKYGTKTGGVIAGIPSTAAIALFFIGWTHTPTFASQATTLIPIVCGINGFFVIIYLLLFKRNFYLAVISGLIFWLVFSLLLIRINLNNFGYSLLGSIILALLAYYILEKKSKIRSEGKKIIKNTVPQLLFRATLGGFIIALAVLLAKVGGPLVGSVFSAFPALFLGTIIVTYFAHGESFSAAVMKVTVMSANINVSIYAAAVRYLYPLLGLIAGTALAFIISLLTGYLFYLFAKKKMS